MQIRCLAAYDSRAKVQLFSHRNLVQMRCLAVHGARAKFSLGLNTSNII